MGDHVVPGMGDDIRAYVEDALKESRVETHTRTRVRRVTARGLVFEHNGAKPEMEAAAVVWTGGVRMNPLVERLEVEKDRARALDREADTCSSRVRACVRARRHSVLRGCQPALAGTAQLALQEAGLSRIISRLLGGRDFRTKHFEELGEALVSARNTQRFWPEAVPWRRSRPAGTLYALHFASSTWHHRLKVGASWFFEGTAPRPLQPLGF